jgi:hypothetical protein
MNEETSLSAEGQETQGYCNGTAGAPFFILTTGDWEGRLRIYIKFKDCTTWRMRPEFHNKNIDLRLTYPAYTKLKLVAEELVGGAITITIGH